jgi:hypothetical protein
MQNWRRLTQRRPPGSPVLVPARHRAVEVDLKVQINCLAGNVELNDRYSQDTTRTRLSASLRWDNLWQKQHGLGITVQTAPENTDESRVFSASYTWPLASGNYLALYGVKSDSDVAAVGTLNVVGNGVILGVRYIMPLRSRSEGFFHTATMGVDYKDFDQSVALIGGGDFNTPITYLPFILGWDGTWLGEGRTTRFGMAFNFHLRGLVADERNLPTSATRAGELCLPARHRVAQRLDSGWGARCAAAGGSPRSRDLERAVRHRRRRHRARLLESARWATTAGAEPGSHDPNLPNGWPIRSMTCICWLSSTAVCACASRLPPTIDSPWRRWACV